MNRKLAIAGMVIGFIIAASPALLLFCILHRQSALLSGSAIPNPGGEANSFLSLDNAFGHFRTVAMFTIPIGLALIEFSIFKLRKIENRPALFREHPIFCVICYFGIAAGYVICIADGPVRHMLLP